VSVLRRPAAVTPPGRNEKRRAEQGGKSCSAGWWDSTSLVENTVSPSTPA
jgi:hypothetical protein